jgi:uncharacterized membrane protein YccC
MRRVSRWGRLKMADIAVYMGIENLNLTNGQRNTLVSQLQALGQANSSPFPNLRNHSRIRNDNNAAIFEALFDDQTLTIAAIKQRLATIFGVAVGTISHSTNQVANIGFVVTFTHSAQDKLRMVCFGHNGTSWPSWSVSNAAAVAYLQANSAQWNG